MEIETEIKKELLCLLAHVSDSSQVVSGTQSRFASWMAGAQFLNRSLTTL